MNIMGSGEIPGGFYEDITISGSGRIEGDINCKSIKVRGSAKASGNVVVENNMRVSGSAKVCKNIEVLELSISGSFTCDGKIEADKVRVTGSCKSDTISATNMEVTGGCTATEVNVELFAAKGVNYNIDRLYAASVIIKKDRVSFLKFRKKANIKYIECATINVCNLVCEKLYAKDAFIGPKCEIEYIEYSSTISIDPRAKVKEVVKVSDV